MIDQRSYRVLVVDDDKDILELLDYNLEKEGFKVKTLCHSFKAISTAKEFEPDLIILDVMMPHPNGIELCRELRHIKRFENTYIFFLTAKSESYYQHAAFDTGGDDYIEKIMGLRALTHKVNAVLKNEFIIRKGMQHLVIGSLKIDRRTNAASFKNVEIKLSKPEFELLFFFAQNPDKLISKENLIHNIWGSEIFLLDSSIDAYIENLKKKLGAEIIQRISRRQYRFAVDLALDR